MTKSHPMHRKKAVNMMFRHSYRVRRLFYKVSQLLDSIKEEANSKRVAVK